MPHEYKITYRNHSTQPVRAGEFKPEGKWIIFYDDGEQVHAVPAEDVESISLTDVEDRTAAPTIGFA
jgi:hypothetical protein